VIISRTPFRISLVGGGSDLKEYYCHSTGAVLTLAINRYMYVTVNKRFDDSIRVSYTRTEIVPRLAALQHELIREAMRMTGVTSGVEITTIADLPAGIGLGSSSSLTVGVLNALFAYKGKFVSPEELADRACRIEIDVVGKPIGKQDQYIAAYGGFQFVRFHGDERVTVEPMYCHAATTRALVDRLLLFYTGITRNSSFVLSQAKRRMTTRPKTRAALDGMVALAESLWARVASNDLTDVGGVLHQGWVLKKEMGSRVTTNGLDGYYARGLRAGATGGKVAGAGGGGCLLFYAPIDAHARVRRAMARVGLKEIPIDLEPSGSTIVHASDGRPAQPSAASFSTNGRRRAPR
jgi:D-glycero-alpha-D-manno-heptose-7-phosphate kinase